MQEFFKPSACPEISDWFNQFAKTLNEVLKVPVQQSVPNHYSPNVVNCRWLFVRSQKSGEAFYLTLVVRI